jgi:hypothetical protein
MLEELAKQKGLRELFDAQGMHNTEVTDAFGKKTTVNTAELYWLASYHEASPTQGYEMLHRLRKDRVRRLKLPGQNDAEADKMVFEMPELRKLLKEIDFNPIWRDRLAAISYRVIGRIDIRRMYEFGVFGKPLGSKGFNLVNPANPIPVGEAEKEVASRYEDLGSTAPDSRLQALFVVRLWEKQQRNKTKTRTQSLVCQLFSVGVIDRQRAEKQLESVFETPDEIVQYLDTCQAVDRMKTVKLAIGTIKRQYLSFQIDANTAKARLNQVGLQPGRAGEYIIDWDIIKLRRPREETAAEMCGWLSEGLIDRPEFLKRLERIGYEASHAERIVRKCEIGILRRSAKEAERIARAQLQERRRREAAEAKVAKERVRLEASRLAKFLATRTEKHLIDYFKEGVISVQEIHSTLLLKSYTLADAQRWITTYLNTTPPPP